MISRREFNASTTVEGRTLSGTAAVYGLPSRLITERGRAFTERIAPGAFRNSLGDDVKLFYQHDASMPLARTRSGTLILSDSPAGLLFSANLPDTTLGNDVRELLTRGDLSGEMSFGFFVMEDEWNAARTERTVKTAKLSEISVVVDAAYPQTQSSLRATSTEFHAACAARLELHLKRMTHV